LPLEAAAKERKRKKKKKKKEEEEGNGTLRPCGVSQEMGRAHSSGPFRVTSVETCPLEKIIFFETFFRVCQSEILLPKGLWQIVSQLRYFFLPFSPSFGNRF
jgi:hypothetical protein